MGPRIKILAIAEAANPEWVSVPLVGWSLATALRRVADVHIVTQIRNRDAFLRAGLVEGADFTAIDSEALAAPVWKLASALRMGEGKGWTTLQAFAALSYPYFERLTWQRFGTAIGNGEFDIVHRITPLSPTIVSPIARRCAQAGIPFVLGPLNGGVRWPKGFDRERRRERELLSYVRGAYRLMPGRQATLSNASAIIVGSRHTQGEIASEFRHKTVYLPENAIDPSRFSCRACGPHRSLRACFIGRMVPYKGPDMLLEAAMPLLRQGRMRLDMIGDGPMLAELEAYAAAQGAGDAVTFHGWVAHAGVQDIASQCSLFAFPSIREFGGGAVLEAMALGLCPLIVDYGGPAELVTDGNGIKIAIGSRARIVAEVRAELERLSEIPELVSQMGSRAREHVHRHFTWERKAQQVLAIYDWVLGRGGKPDLFSPDRHHRADAGP
jgi:glycosyltransferase involved in cell wall biosynthesis